VLEAEMAILDEIDSGLDIDALRDVAMAVNGLRKPERAVLMITHYQARVTRRQRLCACACVCWADATFRWRACAQRLLDLIVPDFVHVMIEGKIVQTGNKARRIHACAATGIAPVCHALLARRSLR
jgi:Fe-S cluster assembly ATP-binding protein